MDMDITSSMDEKALARLRELCAAPADAKVVVRRVSKWALAAEVSNESGLGLYGAFKINVRTKTFTRTF